MIINNLERFCCICNTVLIRGQKSCCSRKCQRKFRSKRAGEVNKIKLKGKVSNFKGKPH
jgi:hypothetical protein